MAKPMGSAAAVEFDHVWYSYSGEKYALRDVSFRVAAGEIVALVGRNGSGKTTALRHLNGLLKPTRGTVSILGVDTRETSVGRLSRHVGLVFQSPRTQLFAQTALEEAAFGPRNFRLKDPLEAARRALARLGLGGFERVPPLSMSGGQQKRLSIAAATSWYPEIVGLDEPTVGQDLTNRMRLLGLIKLWSSRGVTTIIASHDVEFLWLLEPRVIAMSNGSIVADGSAREVLLNHAAVDAMGFRPPQLAEIAEKLRISGESKTVADIVSRLTRTGR